jgi:aldehyde dehydrogenase (NAD+)
MTTTPQPLSRYGEFTQQYFGGGWRNGRSLTHTVVDTNPYDGSILTRIPGASTQDIADAYASATSAQASWGNTRPRERAAIMRRAAEIFLSRREEIIETTIREVGGVRKFAEIVWYFAWSILDASSTYPMRVTGQIVPTESRGEESLVYRRPLGVIGIISPWNSPINLTMRSLAPALALGNAVVVKPASDTPITGGLMHARIFEEAGLPRGVINVVVGASSEIGDAVVQDKAASLISFTGSTDVGRSLFGKVGSSSRIKHLGLELGGNAPFVVLDDADIDRAAHALVVSRFLHQGQICMSANRAIVDASVFDRFVDQVVSRTRALPYGDPMSPNTVLGPLINKVQVDAVLEKIIPPHVFVDVEQHYAIAQEESFGPLLPILRARDEAHALAIANDTQFGLSAAVFTRDIERGRRFALGVESGMNHVNDICVADSEYAPYGGEKNSGLGRFNAEWVIDEFTRPHWITTQRDSVTWPF